MMTAAAGYLKLPYLFSIIVIRPAACEVARDQDLNTLFALLTASGHEVVSVRMKTNRLEELFMRLVEAKNGEVGAHGR